MGHASRISWIGAPLSSNSSSGRYERSHSSSALRCASSDFAAAGRHLVRVRPALHGDAAELLDPGPALERAHDDHRPGRPLRALAAAAGGLKRPDLVVGRVERPRQIGVEVLALDDQRVPAVTLEQLRELLVAHRLVDRRIRDLEAVDVQDRKHRAGCGGIEELVGVPGAGGRSGLGLAVADDAGSDQVRVVEHRAEGRRECVAELAALVDRPGHDRSQVARKAARPGEAADQLPEPVAVAAQLRLDVLERAVDPEVREVRRCAVTGSGDQEDARAGVEDQPVQPGIHQVETRHRAPVPEQPRLDVLVAKRFLQQVVVLQVDHRGRDVVRGAAIEGQSLDQVP